MRKVQFQDGRIYHAYNRGTDKRPVFDKKYDYSRFLLGLQELNRPDPIIGLSRLKRRNVEPRVLQNPLVEIIAYCLIPNHYHLLLRQLVDNGISLFMQKVGQAYTKYFNNKYDRSGVLFQGPFKAVPIETDEQLLYVAAYINCNAEIHGLAKADEWPWSSNIAYICNTTGPVFVNKEVIMKEFSSTLDLINYNKEVISNARDIKNDVKDGLLEKL